MSTVRLRRAVGVGDAELERRVGVDRLDGISGSFCLRPSSKAASVAWTPAASVKTSVEPHQIITERVDAALAS